MDLRWFWLRIQPDLEDVLATHAVGKVLTLTLKRSIMILKQGHKAVPNMIFLEINKVFGTSGHERTFP